MFFLIMIIVPVTLFKSFTIPQVYMLFMCVIFLIITVGGLLVFIIHWKVFLSVGFVRLSTELENY